MISCDGDVINIKGTSRDIEIELAVLVKNIYLQFRKFYGKEEAFNMIKNSFEIGTCFGMTEEETEVAEVSEVVENKEKSNSLDFLKKLVEMAEKLEE